MELPLPCAVEDEPPGRVPEVLPVPDVPPAAPAAVLVPVAGLPAPPCPVDMPLWAVDEDPVAEPPGVDVLPDVMPGLLPVPGVIGVVVPLPPVPLPVVPVPVPLPPVCAWAMPSAVTIAVTATMATLVLLKFLMVFPWLDGESAFREAFSKGQVARQATCRPGEPLRPFASVASVASLALQRFPAHAGQALKVKKLPWALLQSPVAWRAAISVGMLPGRSANRALRPAPRGGGA